MYHFLTDLHLAAIVGKMLLDRNSELEEKLVRLQEIAKQASLDYEVRIE